MNTLIFFYKNPLTWFLLLTMLLVSVAFVLAPSPEELERENSVYEQIKNEVNDNPRLSELISEQQAKLEHKNEIILALTDVQKIFGGFAAIFLALYLWLSFRRFRRKEQ